ncbi:hypothetical protein LNV23_05885 [Paucibacter sp. DJ1R-11]|uniref:hypothetical protein n=1 Tax=Paucibacter sp. DJ1R-11 TaxID=2893556 RepID=UPI0021E3F589|nr:hypothetical protein [Paucibacter sp. DJ1R-11]MCV2362982.1 hypothetical protein [Paucibacter sp. DJ1R-11]
MKASERSSQIWAVLAWAARSRQNITYSQLAQATGAFTGGLGAWLEPIQSYCIINKLPPLTVLVVQQESGMPGSGFTGATAAELATAQARVYAFSWLEHGNPGAESLEQAAKQMPSNGVPNRDP